MRTPAGFKDAYRQFCELGWNGLAKNPEFGGQGMPQLVAAAVDEMWNASNMAFELCPMLTGGAIEAIERNGSDELKRMYLPKMVSGEWTGTMNLTEPQAGSDLAAIRTKAVPQDDGSYKLYGSKIFITYGEHDYTDNIVHLVLARTPDAPPGTKGISLFVVPKFLVNADGSLGARNDVRCVSLEHKLGIHASPTAVLAFGDQRRRRRLPRRRGEPRPRVHVRDDEPRALRRRHAGRGHRRARVSARGRLRARPRAGPRGRRARRMPRATGIIGHPDVRRMLMTMRACIEAARALGYVTAAALDRAHRHPDAEARERELAFAELMIPIVKGWSTEMAQQIASLGVQVHGGMGFIEETGAAQYLRDARITTIYEGTTGIQANDLIGRKIARDGGQALAAAIATMRGVQRAARAAPAERAARVIGAACSAGVDALEDAGRLSSRSFGPRSARRARRRGAVSRTRRHRLRRRAARAGGARSPRRSSPRARAMPSFLRAKIATARHFADHCLTQRAGSARHGRRRGARACSRSPTSSSEAGGPSR